MLLIVYVDDMKMAGPKEHMKECWRRLGDTTLIPDFALEKPKGDVEEGDEGAEEGTTHTFLGCKHVRTHKIINGQRVETIEYDVSSSMRRAVAKYEAAVFEATGQHPLLYKVDTPFLSRIERGFD